MRQSHARDATPRARRVAGHLVVVLLLASGARVVHAVDTLRIQRDGNSIRFTGVVPPSEEFNLELPGQSAGTSATLDVWPAAKGKDCPSEAPESGKQVHHLAMVLESTTLKATVPPLQVSQPFCFKIVVARALTTNEATAIAQDAAATVTGWLNTKGTDGHYPPCTASEPGTRSELEERITSQLKRAVETRRFEGNFESAGAQAQIAFEAAAGPRACVPLQQAQSVRDANEEEATKYERRLEQARDELANLRPRPPALPSPLVLAPAAGGATWVAQVSELLEHAEDVAALQQAQDQLTTRAAKRLDTSGPLRPWIDALKRVREVGDVKKRKAAGRDAARALLRDPLARPQHFELRRGDDFVPIGVYLAQPSLMQEDQVVAELAALQKELPPQAARGLAPWRAKFEHAAELHASASASAEALTKSNEDVEAAAAALQKKLEVALTSGDVQQALRSVSRSVDRLAPLRAKTPAPVNFFSVDLGVLAAPWPGSGQDPWIVPYIGVNLYLVPVERKIAFDQLVGSQFLQRASLTIGWVVYGTPSSTQRTLSGPTDGKYPLVGVGWRTGQYTRVLAGALFFEAARANPASREKSLYAAGFAGASIDFDVVKFVTGQIK